MNVVVRPARIEDAAALSALAGALGYPTEPARLHARLDGLLESSEHRVFVAEVAGVGVIGYLHAALRRQLEHDPLVEIVALVVAEARRGAGIGAELVAQAEAWASSSGVDQVRVRSNVTRERTHRFYQRLGYARPKTSHLFVKRVGLR